MKVGFYSPMPPARTGIADYSAALFRELRRHGKVEVEPRNCGVGLYHMGNNGLHAGIYRRALERPGVVVLHDSVLHHFLLGQLDQPAYVSEFVYNYGEWNRGLAHGLWSNRAGSGADQRYFDFPMLRRVAESALAVVVHNPAAAETVKRHSAKARVVEIPHLFQEPLPVSGAEVLRFRQKLGVAPGVFLFGVFGYLRESKRLIEVLHAFDQVHREIPATALLVAGAFASSDLARAAAPLLQAPGVLRLPHLPDNQFWMAARAVNACINLRSPAAGETSGIAIRFMGIGKPVLMTDALECARFPEDAAIRIPPGLAERDCLRQFMFLLPSMAEVAGNIGARGARHIQAYHRVNQAGEQYWKLLCESST